MVNFLDGSANTGKDIMDNLDLFSCEYTTNEALDDGTVIYKFQWIFNIHQKGYISIIVKDNKMSDSSLIGVDSDSIKIDEFARPLGLYNDPSLYEPFCDILQRYCNVTVSGRYSNFSANC